MAISLIVGLAKFAEEIFGKAIEEHLDNLKGAAADGVSDAVQAMLTGRMSLEEWANIASKACDRIIEKSREQGLKYVAGKLRFENSPKDTKKIIICMELYFLNEKNEWVKTKSDCDMYASNFTEEALYTIKTNGKVEFEVVE